MIDVDIAVLGAGIAGSAAARALALAGWRVALIDAKPASEAGPRWVNGVPPWMFDAAAIPRPVAPERGSQGPFVMCDAEGVRRVVVDPSPVWWVDMRLLGDRLRRDALAAGAVDLFEHRCTDVVVEGGRPVALSLAGPTARSVRARLFVDAAGMAGRIRRAVPAFAPFCPKIARRDICSAAQEVAEIADRGAAERFLATQGATSGETLSRSAVAGGFSIQNVQVDLTHGHVDLLTGAIAEDRYPSGPALVADLRARHPWIGPRRFGGAGAIPLRRPWSRLGALGVVLLGDAACQVFAAHGSGIGIGMIAARQLADAVAGAADPGAEAVTWAYSARFHRLWGGRLAAAQLIRQISQALTAEQIARVLAAGLINPDSARQTLDQQLPPLGPKALPALARAAAREPRLAARFVASLRALPRILWHHRRYPQAPDLRALERWDARTGRWLG